MSHDLFPGERRNTCFVDVRDLTGCCTVTRVTADECQSGFDPVVVDIRVRRNIERSQLSSAAETLTSLTLATLQRAPFRCRNWSKQWPDGDCL
jgi:hypothetical protein